MNLGVTGCRAEARHAKLAAGATMIKLGINAEPLTEDQPFGHAASNDRLADRAGGAANALRIVLRAFWRALAQATRNRSAAACA